MKSHEIWIPGTCSCDLGIYSQSHMKSQYAVEMALENQGKTWPTLKEVETADHVKKGHQLTIYLGGVLFLF